ncbi:MAG: hypothetical protein R3F02_06335 [Thiolinea sp.]
MQPNLYGEGFANQIASEICLKYTMNDADKSGKKIIRGIKQGEIDTELNKITNKIKELQDEVDKGRFFRQLVALKEV